MKDLGVTENYDGLPVPEPAESHISYPEIYLHGDHAKLMGIEAMKAGQEYEATIRFKVKSREVREESDGKISASGSICLLQMSDVESDEEEEETDIFAKSVRKSMIGG